MGNREYKQVLRFKTCRVDKAEEVCKRRFCYYFLLLPSEEAPEAADIPPPPTPFSRGSARAPTHKDNRTLILTNRDSRPSPTQRPTTRVNSCTVNFRNLKDPRKEDSFEYGWKLGMEIVLPHIRARSLNSLTSVVQQKIRPMLGSFDNTEKQDDEPRFPSSLSVEGDVQNTFKHPRHAEKNLITRITKYIDKVIEHVQELMQKPDGPHRIGGCLEKCFQILEAMRQVDGRTDKMQPRRDADCGSVRFPTNILPKSIDSGTVESVVTNQDQVAADGPTDKNRGTYNPLAEDEDILNDNLNAGVGSSNVSKTDLAKELRVEAQDMLKIHPRHKGHKGDLIKFHSRHFKKKRQPAASHILVIMISDEERKNKPYALPIQFVPYSTL
uniref:Uncharacterized protein n=1 Tax=Branchiostoma floridae TaxID=7739 RepID=C3ZB13_BRAFL|eukprot:XP_002594039.1 hypothetical protein BRAFLDRAFT_68521 [Branchiostoma floridae]